MICRGIGISYLDYDYSICIAFIVMHHGRFLHCTQCISFYKNNLFVTVIVIVIVILSAAIEKQGLNFGMFFNKRTTGETILLESDTY